MIKKIDTLISLKNGASWKQIPLNVEKKKRNSIFFHQGYLDDSRKEPVHLKQIDQLCEAHEKLKSYINKEWMTVDVQTARLMTSILHHFNESSARVLKVNKTELYARILSRLAPSVFTR